jgi:drug/metabolite transporter (DMT)-like permease
VAPPSAPEPRPPKALIVAAVAIIVLIWALNFLAAKIGDRYLPPLTLASIRVTVAALALSPFLFTSRAASSRQTNRLTARDLWVFTYLGFFGVCVNQICFTVGLRYTPVGHAAIIVGMGPVYTLVLAVLLGMEQATVRKVVGMAVAFGGMIILGASGGVSVHSPSLLGDVITFCGSAGFAAYVVLGKSVASNYDALTMTAFNHLAGAVLILPLTIRQFRAVGPLSHWRDIAWQGWAAALFMALFSSALAYVLYFWALRYLEATQLAAFTYALPVVAILLGVVFLGERTSWSQALGGALALAGVYWVESGRKSVTQKVQRVGAST